MQVGLLTDSLSTLTRAEALDTAAELGIETVEIGLGGPHGGWSPAPHADLAELLGDPGARAGLQRDITSRGLRLEALNAAGNPLHPVNGAADDHILRSALQLAEEFEIDTVVAMSGLPAAPGDRFPAWITTVWPPENLELLDHQWSVAVDYWGRIADEARRRGVRLAIEMHANQLVYSVPGLLRLREAVGDTLGANFDPSHLMWMGADPIAAIGALTGAIHHVHAKDTRIEDRAAVASRLETTPNERTGERAWNYVAVGTGHPGGVEFWAAFVDALRDAGYSGPLSIENEDYTLGPRESVALAVDTLQRARSAATVTG
ncbi:sugar phosphate isomerase/epimerase [Rhodococcus sp. T2V]|uniref:sugar phosphate isomerase/epimerase family protein n=1 Tax=Rhodococcus sp. T2V TaxID=3034164 RepID=UPI0023E10378|nr:sugar phosphate isomerase/epimerase [Rhodococcus sp. T2V]MDF3313113.1 sugar phosphate isomerase/epimerase [Rhodococcus sp. T2V]